MRVAAGYEAAEREVVRRVLAERRDVRRGFVDVPVADEVLTRILAGAHRAPSVGLSQPWDFLLIRDVATRRAMRDLAVKQRDAFAASLPDGRQQRFDGLKIEAIIEAPLNIAVTCDAGRGGRHVLGRHADPRTTWFSVAIAVQNLWLAARAEGVGVGWVSFFDPAEGADALGLPGHVELVAYLCVGHVEQFAPAPELITTGWARRRPLAWAVHHEQWGRRALPGELPASIMSDAVAAMATTTSDPTAATVRVVVGEGVGVELLDRAEDLVVDVGTQRPERDFGVLWRPARTDDEAMEHGVELVRDLWLQGTGRLVVRRIDDTTRSAALTRGLELGAGACGVALDPVGVGGSGA